MNGLNFQRIYIDEITQEHLDQLAKDLRHRLQYDGGTTYHDPKTCPACNPVPPKKGFLNEIWDRWFRRGGKGNR